MAAPASLIPELEEVLQHGSAERRVRTLQRITTLFLNGAEAYNEEHVALFDGVFMQLVDEIETKARAELSYRLAPVSNAPREAVRRLARDDDIAVARPVLERSPRLPDTDLVDIARTKSQAHLLAISGRSSITEVVTDELVRRGDRAVVRSVAANRRARLSEKSFSVMVSQAEEDGILAEKVGTRPDIPPQLFQALLLKATAIVQQRLIAAARPETQAEIRRVLARVSAEVGSAKARDFSAAERAVEALQREGKLDEATLVDFAKAGKYEESVAALSRLCKVPVGVVDRLMGGDRPDPILILCKSAGWEWPTAKALIVARPSVKGASSAGLDNAFTNFQRLSPATAQRVMRFWQVHPAGGRR
ncbi:MAG: DUF2336 domain-containing protein [Hyphomicrobiales bacterium]|nr:DUF2336 domain-containing protein [Hyphomicrobiales bacterium]